MLNFSLNACGQKFMQISSQKLCNMFSFGQGITHSYKKRNPMIGSRSKYRFSRVKVK